MSQSIDKNKLELPSGWKIHTLINEVPLKAVSIRQIHGNRIINANDVVVGGTEADGIFIDRHSLSAAIHTADCMPLVLTTRESALILHVSRKSLIGGLLDETLKFINPKDIVGVYIGPHICSDHFSFAEAGEEIIKFREMFPEAVKIKENEFHLSLREAVGKYFRKWELDQAIVQMDPRCTFEDKQLPSYKRRLGTNAPLCWMVTVLE